MSKKVGIRNFAAISRLKALVSVIETFNRTDSASLGKTSTGASWSNVRGSWGISSNKASSSDAGSTYPLATLTFSKEDVTLTAKGVGPGVGTAFWVTDSNNWWGTYVDTEQTCQTCSTPGNCNAYGSVYSSGGNCATYGTQVTANNPTVGTTFCATANPTVYATQVAANSTCTGYGTNYSGGNCASYGTSYSGGTCANYGITAYSAGNCVYGLSGYSGGTCATNGVVGYTAGNTNYVTNYSGGNFASCMAYGSAGNCNSFSTNATTYSCNATNATNCSVYIAPGVCRTYAGGNCKTYGVTPGSTFCSGGYNPGFCVAPSYNPTVAAGTSVGSSNPATANYGCTATNPTAAVYGCNSSNPTTANYGCTGSNPTVASTFCATANPTVGTTFCATANPTYYSTFVSSASTCTSYGTNYTGGTPSTYGTVCNASNPTIYANACTGSTNATTYYACNCVNNDKVKIVKNVAGTISTVATLAFNATIQSIKTVLSGNNITVSAYSDTAAATQIGSSQATAISGQTKSKVHGILKGVVTYSPAATSTIDQFEAE